MANITIQSDGRLRWVVSDSPAADISLVEERCSTENLRLALTARTDIDRPADIAILSARVNRSGRSIAPRMRAPSPFPFSDPHVISDLPDHCEVIIERRTPGGNLATITIWVPLAWNGRFMGTAGGGNRTESGFSEIPAMRAMTMPTALRNGFATARTDGANRSDRLADWGLDEVSHMIDQDLTEQWIHLATHDMTVIAKAVTEAIHARPPLYSYLAGCSGGGRQAVAEAQLHPGDYDGLWASDPAINWTRFIVAELWPVVVMRQVGALSPAKLEVFRDAAIEAGDGVDGLRDGVIGALDPCSFDAGSLVGQETTDGPISADDARAMTMIWGGRAAGTGASYGMAWEWAWRAGGSAACMRPDKVRPDGNPCRSILRWAMSALGWRRILNGTAAT